MSRIGRLHSHLAGPLGYQALIERFDLQLLPHYRSSFLLKRGGKQLVIEEGKELHYYPRRYALLEPENVIDQLEFALRHDGVNLAILSAVFSHLDPQEVVEWVQNQPTGKYSRMIWFFYEYLTGTVLPLSDANNKNYVLLLDPNQFYTTKGVYSRRHGILNNMLGNPNFCPMVRRNPILDRYVVFDFSGHIDAILSKYDPAVIARAISYLYLKETRSSYEIEREEPGQKKMMRFVALLKRAGENNYFSEKALVELQNLIVDPRFVNKGWRTTQNYIGETIGYDRERVHYISPKPEDVPKLMMGLLSSIGLMNDIHPVIAAAILSFGFVFIHPFDDGNGRIHRFLIHHLLSQRGFTPSGMIFPISATMLKDIHSYDQALEIFSRPLMAAIGEYRLNQEGEMTVVGNHAVFYRFIDFTPLCIYLFSCMEATLHTQFVGELEFIVSYDATRRAIQEIVDLPDKLINLVIQLVTQNYGSLSANKRHKYFSMLSDEEISLIELAINTNIRM